MGNKTEIAAVLDQLIEKRIAFACWFHPRETKMGLLAGNPSDVSYFDRFDQLNGEAGFVFAPYHIAENSPVILLKPGIFTNDYDSENPPEVTGLQPFSKEEESGSCPLQTKDEYLDLIKETIETIHEGALSKVIISRQIPVCRPNSTLGTTFVQLQEQTPNAFTYLVNLPVAGVWMGATPEVLIKSDGKNFETVSLAGTQVRKPGAEEYYWSRFRKGCQVWQTVYRTQRQICRGK